ncbi:MAG: NUDIX hydrolase [Tessaracoccus sp.]|uniref:NUDIX hydrolase n=1 Tax=Tessaracoccus sp. TaxID=1971211 RepID=UPI001EBDC958|nr:NUDIX hydrolase [Tessaracoccus sp.]MBK7821731.1 NUDIX hydrolase [Tessaracoccus sp.]
MTEGIFSVVSVDVVAVAYDRGLRRVLFASHARTAPPFEGDLALPGVVVLSGERLEHAAGRALAKLGLPEAPTVMGQLRTFDEPARDPRGPSLSIAMWAAFPVASEASPATWSPLDAAPHLSFDHDHIVAEARGILAGMLWRDLTFTRALTGPQFSAADAVAITAQLSGREVHRANLNRDLAKTPGLVEAGLAPATGGRPPKLWRWEGGES